MFCFASLKLGRPFAASTSILRNSSSRTARALMNVPRVELAEGKLLYMLIKIYVHGETLFGRTIVRGWRAKHHGSIFKKTRREMDKLGLCVQPLGGGKILHDSVKKEMKIGGKSKEFGRANHKHTREILSTWSKYKGYKIDIGK